MLIDWGEGAQGVDDAGTHALLRRGEGKFKHAWIINWIDPVGFNFIWDDGKGNTLAVKAC